MTGAPRPAGAIRTIVVAGSTSVHSAIPPFLLGSLAVFVRRDLGFGPSQLGLAVAAFFLASAAGAIPGGRLAERIGARKALLGTAAVTGFAMAGIAVLARTWLHLLVWLVIAGLSNGTAQPAGNLALARGVGLARRGLAFGIKQASIPTATLFAGAAVPLIGLTVGWRWAFAGAALGALFVAGVMPRDPYVSGTGRRGRALRAGDAPLLPLVVLATAGACGAAAGTALASFYVEGAVAAGFGSGFSGGMLVVGSLSAISARLFIGWYADRRAGGHLVVVMALLTSGAVGFLGLALTSDRPWLLLPATVLGFAAGWGWPGLFNYVVVRLNPNAPAAATAITQTGIFAGGVTGPASFGAIAENASFEAAWTTVAVVNVVAAAGILLSRRLLRP